MTELGLKGADLTAEQRLVLEENGGVLVVGRPGTGKTTVAILKALRFLESHGDDESEVLFLSFSNAAVQRIHEAARRVVPRAVARRLEVGTFHSFCFGVLRSHARLLGMPVLGRVILPDEKRMLERESSDIEATFAMLRRTQGRLHFDAFLSDTLELFARHPALRDAYARAYPLIIVDEYQDTTDDQDQLIAQIGAHGQVVYLGDPDQRIYDYDPRVRADRFERLLASRAPLRIDLPLTNHRSGGADIVDFGRAVLSGLVLPQRPRNVTIFRYGPKDKHRQKLREAIVAAERAVRGKIGSRRRPNVGILCYRNAHAIRLSRDLSEPFGAFTHPFHHRLYVPIEDLAPAWMLFLTLLACPRTRRDSVHLADGIHEFGRYERSSKTKKGQGRGAALVDAAAWYRSGGKKPKPSLTNLPARFGQAVVAFTGHPAEDIAALLAVLRATPGEYLASAVDAIDLRSPADAGSQFLDELSDTFARHGDYRGAQEHGQDLLMQEKLLDAERGLGGRIVTTLHKTKGKEFDAVVIVDGPAEADGLVLSPDPTRERSRRLLNMAITRARHHACILTPVYRVCPLLPDWAT